MDLDGNLYRILDRQSPLIIERDRDGLIDLFAELGYKHGAEIGTERGIFAERLCRGIPGLQLHCIDAWQPYEDYKDYQGDFYEEAKARLEPYHVDLIRKMSMDAAPDFQDNSLDFVYIDANHNLPYIADDICAWSRKVRPGGIVSGHDYVSIHPDVKAAVNNYVELHHIRPWFLMGNTKETNAVDWVCSWLWVKA